MNDLELREEPQDELEQILSTMAFKCAGGITHSGRKEYTDAKQQILDWHNKKVNEARIDELKLAEIDGQLRNQDEYIPRFIRHEDYMKHRIKALKEKGGE